VWQSLRGSGRGLEVVVWLSVEIAVLWSKLAATDGFSQWLQQVQRRED